MPATLGRSQDTFHRRRSSTSLDTSAATGKRHMLLLLCFVVCVIFDAEFPPQSETHWVLPYATLFKQGECIFLGKRQQLTQHTQ